MTDSAELLRRAQALMPGGVSSPVRAFRSVGGTPFFTERAEGAHLHTADGRALIDLVCTWGPAIHGHNHPLLREALQQALEAGTSFGTPCPGEVALAEQIVRHVPSAEKVRFCNSGTEACMSALRLARGITRRDKIVKCAGCYHGHADALLVQAGSGALTLGQPDSAGVPAAVASDTLVIAYNDVQTLQDAFARYGAEIAAVIVEPYPANCGLLLPEPGFLEALRSHCDTYESLLIFDEVMTGFRLGLGGVQGIEGVLPDLTTLGKVIGGGLPVGAIAGSAAHLDHFAPVGPVYQAGTLSGNPLAMAAGRASLQLLEDTQPFALLDARAGQLAHALEETAQEAGLPLQVHQSGSMLSLFFAETRVRTFQDVLASDTQRYASFFHAALEQGVYLPPSAFETWFLSTAHDDAIIEQAVEVLTQALRGL